MRPTTVRYSTRYAIQVSHKLKRAHAQVRYEIYGIRGENDSISVKSYDEARKRLSESRVYLLYDYYRCRHTAGEGR